MKTITVNGNCLECNFVIHNRGVATKHSETTGHEVEIRTRTVERVRRVSRVPAIIDTMYDLGLPDGVGADRTRAALRAAGVTASNELIAEAVRQRKAGSIF